MALITRFLVIFLLFHLIGCGYSLERPSLKNLQSVPLDFDVYSFKSTPSNDLSWSHLSGTYQSTGRKYEAYFATFSPSSFSFYPPTPSGCTKLVQPSKSSLIWKCEYATNAGFFTWDNTATGSYCLGNLISDGKHWQLPQDGSGTGRANFGVTSNKEIVLGFIDSSTIADYSFDQLITGWGWLVREGLSYVASSPDLSYQPGGFTMEKAPRTCIGAFKNGTMALLEIDGEEDILEGADLFEAAELLVSLGIESAINLDGGGSSVSVYRGKVIDKPTCNDTPEICEREDTSIACVRGSFQ